MRNVIATILPRLALEPHGRERQAVARGGRVHGVAQVAGRRAVEPAVGLDHESRGEVLAAAAGRRGAQGALDVFGAVAPALVAVLSLAVFRTGQVVLDSLMLVVGVAEDRDHAAGWAALHGEQQHGCAVLAARYGNDVLCRHGLGIQNIKSPSCLHRSGFGAGCLPLDARVSEQIDYPN
jgi:hypothetical protein